MMIEMYGKKHYSQWRVRDLRPKYEAVDVAGRDFGGGQRGTLQLSWASQDILIVRSKGATQWSGIGQKEYEPARYYLLKRIMLDGSDGWPFVCLVLADFAFGRRWRSGLSCLIALAIQMEAESLPPGFSIYEFQARVQKSLSIGDEK